MWLILEDSLNRIAAFEAAAKLGPGMGRLRLWRTAGAMIQDLPDVLSTATLISLDHDLYKDRETDPDPGCGRDVANFLAKQTPQCRIIIHSSNIDAAWGMYNELTYAGWQVELIHHLDEPGWIESRWLAMAQRLTSS